VALFPAERSGRTHINHQVAGIDDVMRSYYLLRENGVHIRFGPGRHPTSGAMFLYFEGPDGMTYEYSTVCAMIDDEVTYQPRKISLQSTSFALGDPSRTFPIQDVSSFHRERQRPGRRPRSRCRSRDRRARLAHAYGIAASESTKDLPGKPRQADGTGHCGGPAGRVAIREPLPPGVLGEVRIPSTNYQRRSDVMGIARFMSPSLVSLSSLGRTPLPRHGLGSYFAPQAPLWSDTRLVRDDERAAP